MAFEFEQRLQMFLPKTFVARGFDPSGLPERASDDGRLRIGWQVGSAATGALLGLVMHGPIKTWEQPVRMYQFLRINPGNETQNRYLFLCQEPMILAPEAVAEWLQLATLAGMLRKYEDFYRVSTQVGRKKLIKEMRELSAKMK